MRAPFRVPSFATGSNALGVAATAHTASGPTPKNSRGKRCEPSSPCAPQRYSSPPASAHPSPTPRTATPKPHASTTACASPPTPTPPSSPPAYNKHVGSSAGRRDANYTRHRDLYQQGNHPCWLQNGPWCTGIGLTVDHVPAMHTVGGPLAWQAMYRRREAHYAPACKPCQDHQGVQVRNAHRTPSWTF